MVCRATVRPGADREQSLPRPGSLPIHQLDAASAATVLRLSVPLCCNLGEAPAETFLSQQRAGGFHLGVEDLDMETLFGPGDRDVREGVHGRRVESTGLEQRLDSTGFGEAARESNSDEHGAPIC